MTNVAHASLSGANLHEPKGIGTATLGTAYVADGAGSGSWIGIIPVGGVLAYCGTSAPSKFLFCYGQAISRATYATLFSAVSTTYGVGDGTTTFNVPDIRGRVIAGQDDMGGSSANRLTGTATGGIDGDVLGGVGGEEAHAQTLAELFAHYHSYSDVYAGSTFGAGGGGASVLNNQADHSGRTTDVVGSSQAANIVQPTIILNYIIYTGV